MSLLLALVGVPGVELLGGGPGGPKKKRDTSKGTYWHALLSPPIQRELEQIEPEAAEVLKEQAEQVAEQRAAPDLRESLMNLGYAYKQAYQEIFAELVAAMRQQREEEQIAAAIAAVL